MLSDDCISASPYTPSRQIKPSGLISQQQRVRLYELHLYKISVTVAERTQSTRLGGQWGRYHFKNV